VLVILIIFLFLRNFRSTLIVCTSIPISVVGTFALLYFGGLTLNTMTFGGLALGVGMVVDAAIVVLENSFRHMEEHGKDRLTASIDGSEEVWSAILASILTHIAVFVPLLFLKGVSSILFRQLSIVVCFSLAMSLFVAVELVTVMSYVLAAFKRNDPKSTEAGLKYLVVGAVSSAIIESRGDTVDSADERVFSAAYHAQSNAWLGHVAYPYRFISTLRRGPTPAGPASRRSRRRRSRQRLCR
jgi:multidrug efflux pump subunit AcrB